MKVCQQAPLLRGTCVTLTRDLNLRFSLLPFRALQRTQRAYAIEREWVAGWLQEHWAGVTQPGIVRAVKLERREKVFFRDQAQETNLDREP